MTVSKSPLETCYFSVILLTLLCLNGYIVVIIIMFMHNDVCRNIVHAGLLSYVLYLIQFSTECFYVGMLAPLVAKMDFPALNEKSVIIV